MSKSPHEIPPPAHPLPPDGQLPDLNLAGSAGFSVASGQSIQSMPDPGKPLPSIPILSGSPDLGGIDPAAPVPSLNLAGVEGVPPLSQLVRPASGNMHNPDFGQPDFSQPNLEPGNLIAPGITLDQRAEFAPDPMVPDLAAYRQPYSLDIHAFAGEQAELFRPDPQLGDLLAYEVPSGASVNRDPLASDPLLPDLQQPQLTQDVEMSSRPGDLDPGALEQMHLQPTYQQLDGVPYSQVFMNQAGMNTARRRHYDLLMSGLDSAEQ